MGHGRARGGSIPQASPATLTPDTDDRDGRGFAFLDHIFGVSEVSQGLLLTDWRCADIGTLVRLDDVTELDLTSRTTERVVKTTAIERFRVKKKERSLFGYWESDIELLQESWGRGGSKLAMERMESIQARLA